MLLEEIRKDFYRLVIPLNMESLRSVNVYAIKGPDLSLIVDTGMGTDEVFFQFLEVLTSLGIRLERSLLLITHFHIDHFGFAKKMEGMGAKILMSKKDWERAKRIRSSTLKEEVIPFLALCGCPIDRQTFSFFDEVDSIYDMEDKNTVHFLSPNERIEIGGYVFLVLFTPGHSPGHVTLYEPKLGLYISGDHILKDISPTVQARKVEDDPLKDYLTSLRNISRLSINLALPSHGDPFLQVKKRSGELFIHHRKRLKEISQILEGGAKTIYEIASLVKWEIGMADFYELPIMHKIFAMGEALAHTNYLQKRGKIFYSFEKDKGAYIWSLKDRLKKP
jgi:glyoxylase-like metal-dependent hydrolase (beta-lactamase superfamily II)